MTQVALRHLMRERALAAWNARILSPTTERSTGDRPVSIATAYRPDRLFINPSQTISESTIRTSLDRLAGRMGIGLAPAGRGVRLLPGAGTGSAANAWRLIDALRDGDREVAPRVGLNHLMTVAEQAGGNPFAIGHGRIGLDGYGGNGYPGRSPTVLPFAAPFRRMPNGRRPPRVVLMDTVLGRHPWFEHHPIHTDVSFTDGRTVRWQAPAGPAAFQSSPLDGVLSTHSGHALFLAGLVRQTCPEAEITAFELMGPEGIVDEASLLDALAVVRDKQLDEPGWADALVLSLGYYAEAGDDTYTATLKHDLLELAGLGVAVFCAAGNDATSVPSYPAAFALDPRFGESTRMPLTAVAAANPDGSATEFSNEGPWVSVTAPGVNLVSTVPTSMDGAALQARVRVQSTGLRPRASSDVDRFQSGFASWSGTSFATPLVAGLFLTNLVDADMPGPIPARRDLVPAGQVRASDLPAVRIAPDAS